MNWLRWWKPWPGSWALRRPVLKLYAQRAQTGYEHDRLARMSLSGWSPWLLDTLEPNPSVFDTYVHQFSILLPPGKRPIRIVTGWHPWIPEHRLQRACRQCLAGPARQGLLLMWQLPLLLSCPEHGCLLEPCIGFPGVYLEWTGRRTVPRPAAEQIRAMDRLSIPLSHRRSHASDLRLAWQASGHPVRAGQSAWRPLESMRQNGPGAEDC